MSLSQHLHPLYRISRELISLFFHQYKGDVLEYFPVLVDFTVYLNLNEKQRGALTKLQNFSCTSMCACVKVLQLGQSPLYFVQILREINKSSQIFQYNSFTVMDKEWTFPDLLLGTFRNEKNFLNTFISVCNIC